MPMRKRIQDALKEDEKGAIGEPGNPQEPRNTQTLLTCEDKTMNRALEGGLAPRRQRTWRTKSRAQFFLSLFLFYDRKSRKKFFKKTRDAKRVPQKNTPRHSIL